jgi:hypothetical protein
VTHCGRILELLSDGRWHNHHELYALNVVAHSRIAELRERGHVIDHRRVVGADGEPDYLYQLISSPRARVVRPQATRASEGEALRSARGNQATGTVRAPRVERSESGRPGSTGASPLSSPASGEPAAGSLEQLSFEVAA